MRLGGSGRGSAKKAMSLGRSGGGSRGRPRVHAEAWSKVSLVLFDRQVVYLDHLAADIRRRSGGRLNRTQIVRALVDALAKSRFNVCNVASESALVARLRQKLS